MKRHAALQPLSRDHHVALVAAQRLRRATPETAIDARAHFLAFWHEHGARHFRVEEDVLLPRFAAHADPDTAAIARMLMDHVRIRAKALAVETASVDELHALGKELAAHVRLEERQVFPLIEASLSEAAAAELVAAVQAAEHA
jgi:iron-sulfur cluster repair protein YtfE (RIC family)